MSQKNEIVVWPSKWPFEAQDDYLQLYSQSANLHMKLRKALSKKETKKEFTLDDIEICAFTKVSSAHFRFTGIQNNTNDFIDIMFLTPTTAEEHDSVAQIAEHIEKSPNLVYAEYFVDTKWQLLQEFNKFPYTYVLFFKTGALSEDLMTEILQRELTEVTDDDMVAAFEEFFNQSPSSRKALATKFQEVIEKGPQSENIKKNYPKLVELIQKSSEDGQYKLQQETTAVSPSILKLKQQIVEELKAKGLSDEGKLQLALLLGFFGKFDKTEKYLNELLEKSEDKTLIYYYLYYFATLANQFETKAKYLKQTLEAAEKSSPNKLFVTTITAISDEASNKKTEAAATYESLAEKEQDSLLKAIHLANLGRINYELGAEQGKNAITQYNKALELVSEKNPKHVFLPFFALKIAQVYTQLHNYAKAKGVLEDKAIKLIESIYGKDSFEISQLYKEIGILCVKLEMKRTAIEYFDKSSTILEKSPELYYINITENLNFVALILKEAGDRQGAFVQLQKGLKLLKEFGGLISPQRATLLNGMGELLTHMGDFNSALELIENALEINLRTPEKSSHDISRNYLNLGLLYKRMGHDSMAKDFFERCIEIKCSMKGESHFEVGALLNTLAVLHRDMADFESSLSYYQRSVDIYKKYGEHHPLIALSLNNMAVINKKLGKLDIALDFYKKSLEIAKINVGEEHADYAITLNNIAVVYLQQGQEDLALKTMEQSYAILKKVCGENHPTALSIQQNIAYLKSKIGTKPQSQGQQGTDPKEETKIPSQGEMKLSKNPSYYEEEKKEYRPPKDDDDLPPNLKKNPSKPETQLTKQPSKSDEKPDPESEPPVEKVPDPKDIVIPEEYLQCKSEIIKCIEKVKEVSEELYRTTVLNRKAFDSFAMGLIDVLEGYYTSVTEISEEGLGFLLERYSKHYIQKNYGQIMLAQIMQQLQSGKISVIQFGGGEQGEHEGCACGHPHHQHGHGHMRRAQTELDADDLQAIEELSQFGFDKEKVKNAYILCGKDQNVTMDYLFEMQENEGKE